jgi:transcriptional regulator with XRE-family HTH domain
MSESLTDSIRRAVEESGQSRYAIAHKTGVSQATLSRFMNGERRLSLEIAEKLIAGLGLRVKIIKSTKDK